MQHLEFLADAKSAPTESLLRKVSGRYYTGEQAGRSLARCVAKTYKALAGDAAEIKVLDPFVGDGRLLEWLIEAWLDIGGSKEARWIVGAWDLDRAGLTATQSRLRDLAARAGVLVELRHARVDAFAEALRHERGFDIVVTNPPWELLKPDRRELQNLPAARRARYVAEMRKYDKWLEGHYPLSQPRRKFAGWGTNLSRVGLNASLSLVRAQGLLGIVMPASFLADDQSVTLRTHLLSAHRVRSITYYPAEAKLYGGADVASVAMLVEAGSRMARSVQVVSHLASGKIDEVAVPLRAKFLQQTAFALPISFGSRLLALQSSVGLCTPTLTAREWQVASYQGNSYVLAVLENFSTTGTNMIHWIPDPASRCAATRQTSVSHAISRGSWTAATVSAAQI